MKAWAHEGAGHRKDRQVAGNLTRDEARQRAQLIDVQSYSVELDLTGGEIVFGSVSVISAIEWSIVVGCVISLAAMIFRIARQPRHDPADLPITVRGPITYAGPGSLGAIKSTLRR